jgi:hypothetical protein
MTLARRITEIFARLDPESLISVGAPLDEYKREAKLVADVLLTCDSCQQLEKAVDKIFNKRFGIPAPDRDFRLRKAAEEIYALVR